MLTHFTFWQGRESFDIYDLNLAGFVLAKSVSLLQARQEIWFGVIAASTNFDFVALRSTMQFSFLTRWFGVIQRTKLRL